MKEAEVDDSKRTITIKKKKKKLRVISKQKVCLETIIERDGRSYAEAVNSGRSVKEKLMEACRHIQPGTCVWTDDRKTASVQECQQYLY